jgi:hypothetical protein
MKKLLSIIVLGLLWCTIGIANQLGTNEQLIDYNFRCTTDRDYYIKRGFKTVTIDGLERMFPLYDFGYKKFTTELGDKFLIFLEYDNEKERYILPESTVSVVINSSTEEIDQVHTFYALDYNKKTIRQIRNYKYDNGDYLVEMEVFKLDKTTGDDFIRRIDNVDNITDIDKRVLGFHIVTNHYDKYVTKETNKTAYKQSNKPAQAFRCILFAK